MNVTNAFDKKRKNLIIPTQEYKLQASKNIHRLIKTKEEAHAYYVYILPIFVLLL